MPEAGAVTSMLSRAIRSAIAAFFTRRRSPSSLHLGLEHIGPLPHHRPLVAGSLPMAPRTPERRPCLAQQSHPQLFKGVSICGFRDFHSGLLLKRVQLIGELLQSDWGAHGSGAEGD